MIKTEFFIIKLIKIEIVIKSVHYCRLEKGKMNLSDCMKSNFIAFSVNKKCHVSYLGAYLYFRQCRKR